MLLNIKPRDYQQEIFETCKDKNCLVVLPTGLGKTLIALMLAIERQKLFPEEKILFLAPTRPLAEQHYKYFEKHLPPLYATMFLFTGKTPAETRKKLWEKGDVIFSTPQCIEGNTLIFTEEGPIKVSEYFKKFNLEEKEYNDKKIKIAEIREKILGYGENKVKFLEASKAMILPGEGLTKIKTEMGNCLICTKDHPLLTINQEGQIYWELSSQLNKGDYIASIKEIDIEEKAQNILDFIADNEHLKIANKAIVKGLIQKMKANKLKSSEYSRYYYNFMPLKVFLELSKKVNFSYDRLALTDKYGKSSPIKIPAHMVPKLAYIIGAMLGDGHIGNRKGHGSEVVFSDLDRESVCKEFQNALVELFGIKMQKDKTKGLIAYNSALATILNSLGVPSGNKSNCIRVPKFVFFSNIEIIKNFIKGVFDTDGSAGKYSISISSISERFVQDLKWLFLRIGITGSIRKNINKGMIKGRKIKESEIFTFHFCGRRNIEKFLEIYPNKEKCKILIETLKKTKKPNTRSKEIIPIKGLMKKIHKSNMNKADYYKFSCLSYDNLLALSKIVEGEDASKLKELIKLPFRWVKIKEKEEINKNEEVYDFTIEQNHNFITNSLVSHNCIENDLKNYLYNLKEVSLLIVDECHRCLKNYSYTYVTKTYNQQAAHARVLGLTASPGSEKKIIEQVCENLGIETVEIRNRESEDVKPYMQELEFDIIKLDFPQEFQSIRTMLLKIFNKKVEELKNRKILFMPPTKKFLLECQHRIMRAIASGNHHFNLLVGASACAIAIKIQHALELLETQTLYSLQNYMHELFSQANQNKSKAVQQLIKQPEFNQAFIAISELVARKIENPKLAKLKEIVEQEITKNKKSKIIIFSQYRDNITRICKEMNLIPGIKAKVFVGQAKKGEGDKETGLSQKEQQMLIGEFSRGEVNLIVSSSIGEEGLDIPEVNAVIFYEPIPSAIRAIQRRGRTARLMPGKLMILMIKGTRDEAYHWSAFQKEKRMYKALDSIQDDLNNNPNHFQDKKQQKDLFDYN